MWLFTRHGFYSVTKRPGGGAGELQVRARAKGDLEALKKLHNLSNPIQESSFTDYPFRLFIDAERMAEIVAAETLAIDYTNFKNTIKENKRHAIYLRVWGALLGLMPPRKYEPLDSEFPKYDAAKDAKRDPWPWKKDNAEGQLALPGGFSREEVRDLNRSLDADATKDRVLRNRKRKRRNKISNTP